MASTSMIEQLKKPIRNRGFLQVEFNIIDPDANPELSVNNEEIYSDFDNINEPNIEQTKNYATLEKNFWLLNDSQPLLGSEELTQTYVSSYISDEKGKYTNIPTIEIVSEDYLTTLGLTLVFDSINGNYASMIHVNAYRDDIKIMDKDYEVNAYEDRLIFADNDDLVRWNKIEIQFLESNLPYRRMRIQKLVIGILEVYNSTAEIIEAESKEKTTMINSELPTHTFKFSITNFDKKFNPDNPNGWYRYILQRQPIKYTWGYQLDDGTIEWEKGGDMLLTGSADVKENKVTFSTTTRINYLTSIYKKGTYNASGVSLYDLAIEVLNYGSVENKYYNLWEGLKNIKTDAPLPKLEIRQLLQIIATTANCVLYTDRSNIINIQPFSYTVNKDAWNYNFLTEKPKVQVQTELHDSIVYLNHYTVESETSELFKNEELNLNGSAILEIEYELATNINVSITGGTILNASYYGRYAILEIEQTADVLSLIVTGNKISISQIVDSLNYNDDGEDMTYTNDLVTQMSEGSKEVKLKQFIGDWYNNRNIYSFSNRGDIIKDTKEIVSIQTDFSDSLNGYLVENNIKYNGAWSGDSVVIKMAGDSNVD